MGIIKQGILGGVTGPVGPVVGAIVKKVNTIRSRPKKSAKRIANGLQPQNIKFRLMNDLLKEITPAIKVGYGNKKNASAWYGRAMTDNLECAIIGKKPKFEISMPDLIISKGGRESAWSGKVTFDEKKKSTVSWEIPETAKLKVIGGDQLQVLFCSGSGKNSWFPNRAQRTDLSVTLALPSNMIGETLHVWVFFISADGKKISNSDYIGSGIVME